MLRFFHDFYYLFVFPENGFAVRDLFLHTFSTNKYRIFMARLYLIFFFIFYKSITWQFFNQYQIRAAGKKLKIEKKGAGGIWLPIWPKTTDDEWRHVVMVGKIHRNSRLYAHIFRKATEWEILPPSIVQRAFGAESAFSLSPGFADVDPGQININNCEYRQEPDPLPIPIPIPIANPTAPCLMCSCHAINAAKWQMQNELHTQVAVESDEWLPWLRLFFFDFCFFFSYVKLFSPPFR